MTNRRSKYTNISKENPGGKLISLSYNFTEEGSLLLSHELKHKPSSQIAPIKQCSHTLMRKSVGRTCSCCGSSTCKECSQLYILDSPKTTKLYCNNCLYQTIPSSIKYPVESWGKSINSLNTQIKSLIEKVSRFHNFCLDISNFGLETQICRDYLPKDPTPKDPNLDHSLLRSEVKSLMENIVDFIKLCDLEHESIDSILVKSKMETIPRMIFLIEKRRSELIEKTEPITSLLTVKFNVLSENLEAFRKLENRLRYLKEELAKKPHLRRKLKKELNNYWNQASSALLKYRKSERDLKNVQFSLKHSSSQFDNLTQLFMIEAELYRIHTILVEMYQCLSLNFCKYYDTFQLEKLKCLRGLQNQLKDINSNKSVLSKIQHIKGNTKEEIINKPANVVNRLKEINSPKYKYEAEKKFKHLKDEGNVIPVIKIGARSRSNTLQISEFRALGVDGPEEAFFKDCEKKEKVKAFEEYGARPSTEKSKDVYLKDLEVGICSSSLERKDSNSESTFNAKKSGSENKASKLNILVKEDKTDSSMRDKEMEKIESEEKKEKEKGIGDGIPSSLDSSSPQE